MKYESKNQHIAPFPIFALRVLRNLGAGLFVIALALVIGMWGYHHFEDLSWLDAYVNASMILSGMGPLHELKTDGGKLFAGSYALFSGLIFLIFMGIVFTPIFHRFLHQFHFKNDK